MKVITNLISLLTDIAYQLQRIGNEFVEQSKVLKEINTHRYW